MYKDESAKSADELAREADERHAERHPEIAAAEQRRQRMIDNWRAWREKAYPKQATPRVRLSARTRFQVLARCNFRCAYCGRPAGEVALTVDHVIPLAHGGSNDESNLVAACFECNVGKAASLLEGSE